MRMKMIMIIINTKNVGDVGIGKNYSRNRNDENIFTSFGFDVAIERRKSAEMRIFER